MAKLLKHSNHRVEVFPVTWRYKEENHEEMKKECRNLIGQIERHVDGYSSMDTVWDTQEQCSFCYYSWEVDDKTGEPLCCKKAQDEWAIEVLERSQKR